MEATRLILVGGFLGAGKTTLLWETAMRIMSLGKRVGLITNDQAPELVDTGFLKQNELNVAEVSGSCFCCNFNGLIAALEKVKKEAEADIIVAEPVGSCTDLSATIVQPLKNNFGGKLIVSPLTVVVDPKKLSDILNGGTAGLHPSAAYIFKKQLEESDIILINKTDRLKSNELEPLIEMVKIAFPDSDVMQISAKTGEGIGEWLEQVLTRTDAGKRLVEVDYDVYAEGEAVLGWLNCTLDLKGNQMNWDIFAKDLMNKLTRRFENIQASVGHVKILLESGENYLSGNLTGTAKTLNFRGSAGISDSAVLTLNARVEMSPVLLEQIVKEELENVSQNKIEIEIRAWRCLSPGRPEPTYRFNYIVPDSMIPPSLKQ